jgi:hypothetical protein
MSKSVMVAALSIVSFSCRFRLEVTHVDEVLIYARRSLFHPEEIIHYREEAANNCTHGHYAVGTGNQTGTGMQIFLIVHLPP